MTSFFLELLEYNHHFNQLLAQVFLDNPGKASERSRILFSHLLNAHSTWNGRITSIQQNYGIWEELPAREMKAMDQNNFKASLQILQQMQLEDIIQYKNSRGEEFSNCIKDILFHIINHSTYHRGQVASEFRKNNIEPVATDYIFYKRKA